MEAARETKKRIARMYDLLAASYDRWGPRLQPVRYGLVWKMLELGDGHRVLDVGTGPGVIPLAMRRLGHDGPIVGIDISRQAVQRARRKARRMPTDHLAFHVADAEQLPFPEDSFDRVSCVGAMLLMPDRERATFEICRVLRPGGRGVIVEPMRAGAGKTAFYLGFEAFLRGCAVFRPEFRGLTEKDYRGTCYLAPGEVRSLAERAGMRVLRLVKSMGYAYCSFEK